MVVVVDRFRTEMLGSGVMEGCGDWEAVAEVLRNTVEMYLMKHQERAAELTEIHGGWWKKEMQDSVKAKKEAKKLWDSIRDEVTKERYKRVRKEVKREVAKVKNDMYEELYQRLETKEGEMELFKITKQRDRQGKDVHQARVIKNKDGEVLVEKQKVKQRWKEYFDNLLNQENPRERREIRMDGTERMVDEISVT